MSANQAKEWAADPAILEKFSSELVCSECLGDVYLGKFIEDSDVTGECRYCHQVAKVRTLEELVNHLLYFLRKEYTDSEVIAQERAQSLKSHGRILAGQISLSGMTTNQVLTEHKVVSNQDPPLGQPNLLEDLTDILGRDKFWESEESRYGPYPGDDWSYVTYMAKRMRRFTFLIAPVPEELESDGFGAPIDVIESIAKSIDNYDLIRDQKEGSIWWRARAHDPQTECTSAKALGSPPFEFASESRMSPRGVPMFYAAESPESAKAEIRAHMSLEEFGTQAVTVGKFRQLTGLKVLDLTLLSEEPSLFDPDGRHDFFTSKSLISFKKSITDSSPIDSSQMLHYIPSQIIAEYLHFERGIDGVVWNSIACPGALVCALFLLNSQTDADTKENATDPSGTPAEDSLQDLYGLKKVMALESYQRVPPGFM